MKRRAEWVLLTKKRCDPTRKKSEALVGQEPAERKKGGTFGAHKRVKDNTIQKRPWGKTETEHAMPGGVLSTQEKTVGRNRGSAKKKKGLFSQGENLQKMS